MDQISGCNLRDARRGTIRGTTMDCRILLNRSFEIHFLLMIKLSQCSLWSLSRVKRVGRSLSEPHRLEPALTIPTFRESNLSFNIPRSS